MSSHGKEFVAYLKQNLPLVEECIQARVPTPNEEVEQAADLYNYLFKPLGRFVASGGKRVRPTLCLLGAEAVGANASDALCVAAAVELFQAAALIHDDIADESELRRGLPCLHVSEGTGIAINAGDAALVSVTSCILNEESLSSQTRIDMLKEIVTMENYTLEGQALDLGWARDNRWDISAEDYLAMARRKTAYYSAAVPLVLGAMCGKGSLAQVEALRRFGLRTGLAFQIQDDLLNLVGDADSQGKDYRSDITEGKRTLVMMWALEHLDQDDRIELVNIMSSRTTDTAQMNRAVELANKAGALDYAQTYAHDLTKRAKEELKGADIAKKPRKLLLSMADFFVKRTY